MVVSYTINYYGWMDGGLQKKEKIMCKNNYT